MLSTATRGLKEENVHATTLSTKLKRLGKWTQQEGKEFEQGQ